MNIYKVTYSKDSSKRRDTIPDSQWLDDYRLVYKRNQEYINHEGKLAYVVIDVEKRISEEVKAISEEVVSKSFKDRTIDYYGQTKRVDYDVIIELVETLDASPFEQLNPNHCKEIGNNKVLKSIEVGESIVVMEDQQGFDKMSDVEKKAYLNDDVYAEDTHTWLGN